jgi:hypothetical protein
MESEPDSLEDILVTLKTSLVNLLQTVKSDPWSLLMVQTLIWSFKRWAIAHLMAGDFSGTLREYVWDSHIDLVQEYAPEGLREFGTVWLNPTNVGDRVDMLEELNDYFLVLVDRIDAAIRDENEDQQNMLSVFLDETIAEILDEWLRQFPQYRIYPLASENVDSFPAGRIFTIMQTILESHARAAVAQPIVLPCPPAEEPAPQQPPESPQPQQPPEPPAPQQPPEQPAAPPTTLREAFHRRRTYKIRHHAKGVKGTRKQQKTTPI